MMWLVKNIKCADPPGLNNSAHWRLPARSIMCGGV
jgi:hypothetical protein